MKRLVPLLFAVFLILACGTFACADVPYEEGLYCRHVSENWDDENGCYIYESVPDGALVNTAGATLYYNIAAEFFYVDADGNMVSVPFSDLTFVGREEEDGDDDPDTYYTVEEQFCEETGLAYTNIWISGFGDSGYAEYNGSRVQIFGKLPDIAFYSSSDDSEDTFIFDDKWTCTPEDNTVYLASRNGITLTDFINESRNTVTVTWLDEQHIQISVIDLQEKNLYGICRGSYANGDPLEDDFTVSFNCSDGFPHLFWRMTSTGVLGIISSVEDGYTDRELMIGKGYEQAVEFLYGVEGGELENVKFKDLAFEGDFFTAEKAGLLGKFVRISANGVGEGTVTYTDRNVSMRVVSALPSMGFYRAAEVNWDNYMEDVWTYDGTSATRTVYLMASDESFEFTGVVDCSGLAVKTRLAEDGSYIAVSWISAGDLDWLELKYNAVDEYGNELTDWSAYISVKDESPEDSDTYRRMRAGDGTRVVTVEVNNGQQSVELSGSLNGEYLVLAASYDADGRFKGLVTLTDDTTVTPGDISSENGDLDALRLFWLDVSFVPQSEHEEIIFSDE